MAPKVQEQVRVWLEQTIENSQAAVDHGWRVEVAPDNDAFMVIDSDIMPFKILVSVEEDITYIAFVSGLDLAGLPLEVVGPIYRDLLGKNSSMALSKFCLMGDKDTVGLRTDLYSDYMDKREFNMALESVIMGGRWLMAQLGQTEDENKLAKEMSDLGSAELMKGTPPEDIVARMVEAGFPEERALDLVKRLAGDLRDAISSRGTSGDPKRAEGGSTSRTEGARRDNPVDRYIW